MTGTAASPATTERAQRLEARLSALAKELAEATGPIVDGMALRMLLAGASAEQIETHAQGLIRVIKLCAIVPALAACYSELTYLHGSSDRSGSPGAAEESSQG